MNAPVTLGADPEIFVKLHHNTVPIFHLDNIGGTKDQGIPMKGLESGFSYLEDGAALEFNIPPATNVHAFVNNIATAMGWIKANLLQPNKLTVSSSATMTLKERYREHPKASVFGCSADYYTWDNTLPGFQRTALTASVLGDSRCAGFHLHLGYNRAEVPPEIAARFMDLYVGLKAVRWDKQGERRKFYGLPGLYRPKPYGIEYRTLSSEIFDHKDKYSADHGEPLLSHLARRAFRFGMASNSELDFLHEIYTSVPWADVQTAILKEDGKLADEINDWFDAIDNDH